MAVDKAAFHFDKLYDYRIPHELKDRALPGCRVLVPFGGGNRKRQGIILEVAEQGERLEEKTKPLNCLLDQTPILDMRMLRMVQFLKSNTFCTYYDAVKTLLPYGLGMEEVFTFRLTKTLNCETFNGAAAEIIAFLKGKGSVTQTALEKAFAPAGYGAALRELIESGAVVRDETLKRNIQDETAVMVRLCMSPQNLEDTPFLKLTRKQKAVTELLEQTQSASLKEICYMCGVTRAVVENLVKRGVAELFEAQVYRNPYAGRPVEQNTPAPQRTPEQENVLRRLDELLQTGEEKTVLLYGVTGSGKTRVYLDLVEDAAKTGRASIVLVPEIALTSQTVQRFRERFGDKVAVLHSALTLGERLDEWKRIKKGEVLVAIGTRSAVFAPFHNLGLIILDEEQEPSYKSEASPRYHARDVARFRSREEGALLLLASATPSVESYYLARTGKYELLEMQKRAGQAILPQVQLVDMCREQPRDQMNAVSVPLIEALQETLEAQKQAILFLNRRGHHTAIKCSQCGTVLTCPHCSISLTFHSANGHAVCHYCGYSREIPAECQNCHSPYLKFSGAGTQLVEARIKELFPAARILRMDADTTLRRFSHETFLSAFARHEYDVLIGTQMVAKGLDFPDVTLVGVLSADSSLYSDDFKACERTFSLITQVVGRSGRSKDVGRALIQTFSPEHEVLKAAAKQEYPQFYEGEIALRKLSLYPPFCDLCLIGFSGEQQRQVQKAAGFFMQQLTSSLQGEYHDLPVRAFGPTEGTVLRLNNKYRYKILLKCKNTRRMRALIAQLLVLTGKTPALRGVSVFADMNCENTY